MRHTMLRMVLDGAVAAAVITIALPAHAAGASTHAFTGTANVGPGMANPPDAQALTEPGGHALADATPSHCTGACVANPALTPGAASVPVARCGGACGSDRPWAITVALLAGMLFVIRRRVSIRRYPAFEFVLVPFRTVKGSWSVSIAS